MQFKQFEIYKKLKATTTKIFVFGTNFEQHYPNLCDLQARYHEGCGKYTQELPALSDALKDFGTRE